MRDLKSTKKIFTLFSKIWIEIKAIGIIFLEGIKFLEEFEWLICPGKEYHFNIEVTKEPNKTILLIEDTLEMTYYANDTKFNFNLVGFNSLYTQLKILPFIIHFLTYSSMKFKKLDLKFENINIKDTHNLIPKFTKIHATLNKLKKVFDMLKIHYDINIKEKSNNLNKLLNQITGFVKIFLDQDYSNFKISEPDKAKFTLFSLGNLGLIFFYNPNSNPMLKNAFSEEILLNNTRISVNGKGVPYSPYT